MKDLARIVATHVQPEGTAIRQVSGRLWHCECPIEEPYGHACIHLRRTAAAMLHAARLGWVERVPDSNPRFRLWRPRAS